MRGVVLLIVFVAAVSMQMERLRGWGFLILCFVVASIAVLAGVWVRERFQLIWNRLPRSRRVAVVGAAIAVFLTATFISNYGTPEAAFNNWTTVACIVLGLVLWGLYRPLSRFFDAIWAYFTNR
jgi:hypothetical protein